MASSSVFLCLTAFVFYVASVQTFDCPEPFGVFTDPDDDQYYYVCENKLPLRGDCNNSIFVPEVCKKTSSVNTTNSGNFTKPHETIIPMNVTLPEYENYEEFLTNETAATNTSGFNETDVYYCNETLFIEMDPASGRYIVKCGANFTNENDTNFMNATSIDNGLFDDLFNITFEGNDTYKIEVFSHNVTYLNETDSLPSNEPHEEIIFLNSGHSANENEHDEKNATTKKDKRATTTQEPLKGTTFMASGSRMNNSNYECTIDGFYPDTKDKTCHSYWECKDSRPIHQTCKGTKVFNPKTTTCQEHAKCTN